MAVVRSLLPSRTLSAVRLVNRAARDEFVDGRCTRITPLWDDAPLSALAGAAPRLRSIVSLKPRSVRGGGDLMEPGDLEAVAEALERLPESGRVALRKLTLGYVSGGAPCLERVAAAARQLTGLTHLEFSVDSDSGGEDVAALLRAMSDAMPALARAHISYSCPAYMGDADLAPLAMPALQRLAALELSDNAAAALLPAMLLEGVELPHLRDLDVTLAGCECDWPRLLPPGPWAAPWLPRLTRLALAATPGTLEHVARALAPGGLRALRALKVEAAGAFPDSDRALYAVLGTCDAAALETLDLYGVPCAAVRYAAMAAAGLPALRALMLDGLGACYDGGTGPEWEPLLDAPLRAPLTRLDLAFEDGAFGGWGPTGLAPLFARGWARSLRALSLMVLDGGGGGGSGGGGAGPRGCAELRHFTALQALPQLRSLKVSLNDLDAAAVDEAAAGGWADGWAPRLVEFDLELRDPVCGPAAAAALRALVLRVPFSGRLERLRFELDCAVTEDELESLSAACVAALPWLARFEFRARGQSEEEDGEDGDAAGESDDHPYFGSEYSDW